jgi:MarR family transcriptional regulator, 2-MHQ and catechol-resistance regulon repressor
LFNAILFQYQNIQDETIMPTHYQGTAQEVLALNTFIKLTRCVEALMDRLSQRGSLEKLTVSQFGVLEALYHLGPMCQSDIGVKLLRSGGNITLVIDNLEKRGLVRRQRDSEDRRMVFVSLTDAGQELIAYIFPQHLKSIQQEMEILTPEEQDTLGVLCRKLGKGAREPIIKEE